MPALTGALLPVRAVLVTASGANPSPSNDPPESKVVIIILASVLSAVALAIIAYVAFLFIRKRSNRSRIADVEVGNDDESIALEDLQPIATVGSPYDGRIPDFSTNSLPNRRTLNERTMALSSNPPSQTDLNAAERGFWSGSRDNLQANTATTSGATISEGQSAPVRPLPAAPTRRVRSSARRLGASRRHGIVFDRDRPEDSPTDGNETPGDQDTSSTPTASGSDAEDIPPYLERVRQRLTDSVLPIGRVRPNTIREETGGDDTESRASVDESSGRISRESGRSGEGDSERGHESEHHDQSSQSSEEHYNSGGNEGATDDEDSPHNGDAPYDGGASHDGDASHDGNPTPDEDTTRNEDAVEYNDAANPADEDKDSSDHQHDYDHRRFSWSDEVWDPNDPEYNVEAAIEKTKKRARLNLAEAAKKASGQSTNSDIPRAQQQQDNRSGLFRREFTRASLIPDPLKLPVRHNNMIHEVSPSVSTIAATTMGVEHSRRAVSIGDPAPDAALVAEYPGLFAPDSLQGEYVFRGKDPLLIESQDIVDAGRDIVEQMRQRVRQEAKKSGEILTEDEVSYRARRLYENGDRYYLPPAAYDTPPSPPGAAARANPSGRIQAARTPRVVNEPQMPDQDDYVVHRQTALYQDPDESNYARYQDPDESNYVLYAEPVALPERFIRPPRSSSLQAAGSFNYNYYPPPPHEDPAQYGAPAQYTSMYQGSYWPNYTIWEEDEEETETNAPDASGSCPGPNQDDQTVPMGSALPSQTLPLAATETSIMAQDGSDAGSREPSPIPSNRSPRDYIPRSHQEPDLRRFFGSSH